MQIVFFSYIWLKLQDFKGQLIWIKLQDFKKINQCKHMTLVAGDHQCHCVSIYLDQAQFPSSE